MVAILPICGLDGETSAPSWASLTLVRFVLLASSLLVAGCYCSHERAPVVTDAGRDAGGSDAGPDTTPVDSPDTPRPDAPRADGGRCVTEVGVGVYVDPVTTEPSFCDG